MFQPFKTVLSTVGTAMEKFQMDATNVRTTLEKFQTDDASHSNGERKISNGWCHPFERLTKNFERMTPAVRTGDASRSNG